MINREYINCLICGKLCRKDNDDLVQLPYGLIICDWKCEYRYWDQIPINLEIRTGFSYLSGYRDKYPKNHRFLKRSEIIFHWSEDQTFFSVSIYNHSRVVQNYYTNDKYC